MRSGRGVEEVRRERALLAAEENMTLVTAQPWSDRELAAARRSVGRGCCLGLCNRGPPPRRSYTDALQAPEAANEEETGHMPPFTLRPCHALLHRPLMSPLQRASATRAASPSKQTPQTPSLPSHLQTQSQHQMSDCL